VPDAPFQDKACGAESIAIRAAGFHNQSRIVANQAPPH
jgi:hypothetical protein